MAKKERKALAFVRRTSGSKEVLYAVTGMPERTNGPKETAHYILFSGNKNKRYKMKINSYDRIKGEITNVKPNFEKVESKLLDEMYSKCCLAFKKQFPR